MKNIYKTLLTGIPDYKEFLTVDEMDRSSRELARRYPDVVSLREIGCTREGHPLLCLKIGEGSRNALVFGLPHPNEPIGCMLLEYFTEALAKDAALRAELDYTWYIVKAWDADGARKNEGWYKGPFTITNYMRHFFRPAGFEQVDWTFPVDYKELHFHDSIPETVAMMNLIDETKPAFIYALHNAGFGGAYWYMTDPVPGIYDDLRAVPAKYGVPIHRGEPESSSSVEYSTAIYANLGIKTEYDHMERYSGKDMKEVANKMQSGDCSSSYALDRYGSFTFLTELPYFYDPRIDDTGPSDLTRKQAVLQKTEEDIALSEEIREILALSRRHLSDDNHYLLAVESFTANTGDEAETVRNMVDADPKYDRTATVAEKFDSLLVSKFYKAIVYAMLLRANESELAAAEAESNPDREKLEALRRGVEASTVGFEKITTLLETEMDYQVVPIRNLVGVQLECGLIVADYLQQRWRDEKKHA